jgi:hypothetical protein
LEAGIFSGQFFKDSSLAFEGRLLRLSMPCSKTSRISFAITLKTGEAFSNVLEPLGDGTNPECLKLHLPFSLQSSPKFPPWHLLTAFAHRSSSYIFPKQMMLWKKSIITATSFKDSISSRRQTFPVLATAQILALVPS